jgi:hypothetical protein
MRGGAHDPTRPVAFQADLPAAESCEQLRRSYVDRALGLVTAWGWPSFGGYVLGATADVDLQAPVPTAAARSARQTASETGTNVQEAGVDEPDNVKTDGRLLVRVRDGDLVVDDVTGPVVKELAAVDLPRLGDPQLLLSGGTVVAVGTDTTSPNRGRGPQGTRVVTVSLDDPAAPALTHEVTYSSSVVAARQYGDVVRLVLSAGLPDLDFVIPGRERSRPAALAHNRAVVEASTIADWLPTFDAGDGEQRLLECTDVAIPPDGLELGTVSVVGFEADDPEAPVAVGLAGATTTTYSSADDLYLGAGPGWWTCETCDLALPRTPQAKVAGQIHVFDFALDGVSATHVASGTVAGTVRDRWSMDSADGTLRLAVASPPGAGNASSVVTLRREGERLVEAGRLDGLGPQETIQAVRWFDDLAVVVTYRQTDPVFTVDLTDPDHPRLLGELKVPGFSSYLHPLGPSRMVGVGSDDRGRAQVGLFDVSDPARVRRLDTESFGRNSWALAGQDPRTFTWLPEHRTVLTVVQRGPQAYVAVLGLAHGQLSQRLLAAGRRADLVRTLGLPDGRVVVVTGDGSRFLDL